MLDIIAGRQVVFHSHKQNNSRRQTLKRVRPIAASGYLPYRDIWSNTLHPGKALPRKIARKTQNRREKAASPIISWKKIQPMRDRS